jgi:CubicO group peptidase (beta-lactamase class C family)
MKRYVWFYFLLLWVGEVSARRLDTNFLKKRIPEMMDSAGVPGLSLGVVKNGKVVWTKNFGKANLATKKPVNDKTIFEAASLSKPLFGYICLRLVDEKKLDLDKPLVEYVSLDSIERFFLMHKVQDKRFMKITARMCLSHSAGFPNGRAGVVPIVFEPTTDMHYSGIGISYLQFVVEKITGKNVETLAQEYVFKPLEMNNSSYVWQSSFADRVANGHGSLGQAVGFGMYAQSGRLKARNLSGNVESTKHCQNKFSCLYELGIGLRTLRNRFGASFLALGRFGNFKGLCSRHTQRKRRLSAFCQ